MIISFLRQFLPDRELEETQQELQATKTELAKSNKLLHEHKLFIEKQSQAERERVEPDFLFFIWTAISIALALGVDTATSISTNDHSQVVWTWENGLWIAISLIAIVFAIINYPVAIKLTKQYALSKQNKDYNFFALSISWGLGLIIVLVLTISLISSFSS